MTKVAKLGPAVQVAATKTENNTKNERCGTRKSWNGKPRNCPRKNQLALINNYMRPENNACTIAAEPLYPPSCCIHNIQFLNNSL